MRRLAALIALAMLAGPAVAADSAEPSRAIADELLGWCWGRALWPEATDAERAAAPRVCAEAAAMWADTIAVVTARDGAGTEDGTRSIAIWVAACMAMNDVREGRRTESGGCGTRDRRMAESPAGLPALVSGSDPSDAAREAAAREAERRLAALVPDGATVDTARAELRSIGFDCDPAPPVDAMVCLFGERALAYARREPVLFVAVFWNLELALDPAANVVDRRVGVATVHP